MKHTAIHLIEADGVTQEAESVPGTEREMLETHGAIAPREHPARQLPDKRYEEGLGEAWEPIRRYWSEPKPENRETVRQAPSPEGLRRQYTAGVPNPDLIAPEGYTLDAAMIARPGNMDIQLDLFLDYANNVKLYPAFQEYFRKSKPLLLAILGKHDPFFIPPGAEAYRRDNPNAVVQFLDTGHFALETHVQEIALAMKQFLASWQINRRAVQPTISPRKELFSRGFERAWRSWDLALSSRVLPCFYNRCRSRTRIFIYGPTVLRFGLVRVLSCLALP
jgi:hypothetical protein